MFFGAKSPTADLNPEENSEELANRIMRESNRYTNDYDEDYLESDLERPGVTVEEFDSDYDDYDNQGSDLEINEELVRNK